MSYPAFTMLFADPERTTARIRVWMAIQPPHLHFTEPRALKVDAVASQAKISTGSASDAINWLIGRGYLLVHRQDRRGVRDVTIAYAISEEREVKHG